MKNTLQNCPSCKLWLYRVFPFLRWWPMVTKETLRADTLAAITGAMILLPQGVAFATIAGLPPEYGLYAAMVPAIVAEPGSPQFISMVLSLTFLTGVFQLILGLARMGVLVNFISHTVVIGFTAGAALLIAGSQIKNFFGINIPRGTHSTKSSASCSCKLATSIPGCCRSASPHWARACFSNASCRNSPT
jgi:SulP family sulfate permease